jgi:hypothetical protein
MLFFLLQWSYKKGSTVLNYENHLWLVIILAIFCLPFWQKQVISWQPYVIYKYIYIYTNVYYHWFVLREWISHSNIASKEIVCWTSATTFSHFFGVAVGGMSATTVSQEFLVLWLVGCQPPLLVRSFLCCGWWDVSHPFQSGVFCVVVGGMSATSFSQEFFVLWLVGCQPPLSVRIFLCCGWWDVSHGG